MWKTDGGRLGVEGTIGNGTSDGGSSDGEVNMDSGDILEAAWIRVGND